MPSFRIITSGPCMTIEADDALSAAEYAADHMPLKRGWTTEISALDLNDFHVQALNSHGRVVNSARVTPAQH